MMTRRLISYRDLDKMMSMTKEKCKADSLNKCQNKIIDKFGEERLKDSGIRLKPFNADKFAKDK